MATSNIPDVSATELELKRRGRRRLIGAITIGLLAIVFLPMIFDSEPKRSGQAVKTQDISVLVPAKEGQPPLPPPSVAPAGADVPKPIAPPQTGVVSAATAEAPVKVAASEPQKTVGKGEKNEKAAKPEAATTAAKTGFVVQLGVFGDADNAKQVVAKMKEAKLAVYTENIPIKSGNATRVRVGPFATRDSADAALAQVKLSGADGKIVPLN